MSNVVLRDIYFKCSDYYDKMLRPLRKQKFTMKVPVTGSVLLR